MSPLGKALRKKIIEDQGKKVKLNINCSNEITELKLVKDILPGDQLNNLIKDRLKKIMELQSSIKNT